MGRGAVLLAVVALGAGWAAPTSACTLGKVAEMPVTMIGPEPAVTVKINGVETRLTVDTGAFFSMVDPAAATRMRLRVGPLPPNLSVGGVSGGADVKVGGAKDFAMVGGTFHNVDFLIGEHQVGRTDGLLGQNILASFDEEFDFANGVIRMMTPQACGNQALAYWTQGDYFAAAIDAVEPPQNRIRGVVTVNGVRLHATFDTGASRTVLSLEGARSAGIRTDSPGVVPVNGSSGVGSRVARTWLAPVASVNIGGEELKDLHLLVSDVSLADSEMLVGADFFLTHRVYVSKKQRQIYFTANGGLAQTRPGAAPPAATTETGIIAGRGDEPTDAAGFGRRAAAYVARGDYEHAIADYDQAIRLSPSDPQPVYDRAVARLLNRQPLLAVTDLDQALKLKPDFTPALLSRGRIKLGEKDAVGGRADLEAALAADPSVRLKVADAYASAGLFAEAIVQYDKWIASQPHNEDLAVPLAGRCWARALPGQELDKAMADCNAALGLRSATVQALAARAIIHLRRGELDAAIADDNAALKLAPKGPWALYVRGLAEQRKGAKDKGDADVAAAVAVLPRLPTEAKTYGVVTG